jgi:hypothetical protein
MANVQLGSPDRTWDGSSSMGICMPAKAGCRLFSPDTLSVSGYNDGQSLVAKLSQVQLRKYISLTFANASPPRELAPQGNRAESDVSRLEPTMRVSRVVLASIALSFTLMVAFVDFSSGVLVAVLLAYGLATSAVSNSYRSYQGGMRPPRWLEILETYRRYIAKEDTADITIANK